MTYHSINVVSVLALYRAQHVIVSTRTELMHNYNVVLTRAHASCRSRGWLAPNLMRNLIQWSSHRNSRSHFRLLYHRLSDVASRGASFHRVQHKETLLFRSFVRTSEVVAIMHRRKQTATELLGKFKWMRCFQARARVANRARRLPSKSGQYSDGRS